MQEYKTARIREHQLCVRCSVSWRDLHHQDMNQSGLIELRYGNFAYIVEQARLLVLTSLGFFSSGSGIHQKQLEGDYHA